MSLPNRIEIDRELCKRSLHEYVRRAWHVVEPGAKFVDGLPVEAICAHLQAVTNGDIRRLLMNVPPGTMKSLLTNVFWPSWEWGPRDMPHIRSLSISHEQTLAIRDNVRMRRLVSSEWFQSRWPLKLTRDVDSKIKFENEKTGWVEARSIESVTGARGDRVRIDDPHSVKGAESDAKRITAVQTFQEAIPTRLNVPEESAIVVIMQRIHEGDVSGYILENSKLGYVHLNLPMRYEADQKCTTSIGWTDPREVEGELLFPERFPENVTAELETALGPYATAGQLQQRPAPRKGGFFEWDKIRIVDAPYNVRQWVRYWDKAGTEGGGCQTAGVKLGIGGDGRIYVAHVEAGHWGTLNRERTIRQTAELDGSGCHIYIEEEGGSGGKESAEATIRNLHGYVVRADRPVGDKAMRADPWSVQVAAGNVCLVRGAWNQAYIDQHKTFPAGKLKDQIDATSGAYNKLTAVKTAGTL